MSAIHHSTPRRSHDFAHSLCARATLLATCLAGLLAGTPSAACVGDPSAVPLVAGDAWRGAGTTCFALDVDSAGLVAVELVQPAAAPRAYLAPSSDDSALRVVRHTDALLVVAAEPGRHWFRVAVADERQQAADFRVATRFTVDPRRRLLAKDEDDSEIEIEPETLVATVCGLLTKDEDDSEIEIEPETLVATVCGLVTKDEDDSEIEIEPETLLFCGTQLKDEDDSEIEIEPETLTVELPGQDGDGDADRVADAQLCAAQVGWHQTVSGRLANGWGDDADTYRFQVTEVAPVAIRAWVADGSGARLTAELFTGKGQRLETVLGEAAEIEVRRVLVPGTYFVRVQSQDGDASYSLAIEAP